MAKVCLACNFTSQTDEKCPFCGKPMHSPAGEARPAPTRAPWEEPPVPVPAWLEKLTHLAVNPKALLVVGCLVVVGALMLGDQLGPKPTVLDESIPATENLVAVDFGAEWCMPCLMLGPTLDELETEYAGRVQIVRIDIDERGALAEKYNVRGIPCIVLFKDRVEVSRRVGLYPKEDYAAWFDAHL